MQCKTHPSSAAVAVCRHCCRGICPDCLADVGGVASCRGPCEREVAVLNDLRARERTAYEKAGSAYSAMGVWFCLFGATVGAIGFLVPQHPPVLQIIGGLLLVGAAFSFATGRKIRSR